MKEQSHKDEMSRALRGDFERLRDRGVATTLAPRDDQRPEAAADEVEPVEAPPEIEPASVQPEPDPEPGPEPPAEPATDVPAAEAEEPRPGWLGRLLGR